MLILTVDHMRLMLRIHDICTKVMGIKNFHSGTPFTPIPVEKVLSRRYITLVGKFH